MCTIVICHILMILYRGRRGGNAGGELAYLRGERGTGSRASDFRPSFSGRYRAAGGTAYMVGEQGPELVIPEQNSRVVAADDIEGVAEAGPSINANFTIQAIDATNMQETLTAQRGNIIGMMTKTYTSVSRKRDALINIVFQQMIDFVFFKEAS